MFKSFKSSGASALADLWSSFRPTNRSESPSNDGALGLLESGVAPVTSSPRMYSGHYSLASPARDNAFQDEGGRKSRRGQRNWDVRRKKDETRGDPMASETRHEPNGQHVGRGVCDGSQGASKSRHHSVDNEMVFNQQDERASQRPCGESGKTGVKLNIPPHRGNPSKASYRAIDVKPSTKMTRSELTRTASDEPLRGATDSMSPVKLADKHGRGAKPSLTAPKTAGVEAHMSSFHRGYLAAVTNNQQKSATKNSQAMGSSNNWHTGNQATSSTTTTATTATGLYHHTSSSGKEQTRLPRYQSVEEEADLKNDSYLHPTSKGTRHGEILNGRSHPTTYAAIRHLLESRKHLLKSTDFDLKTTVGTGTFGRVRVCKLKNSSLTIPFALKILKKSEVIRLKQVQHVNSEKDILLRISHPFIVNLYTTFQDATRLYMVMEFVHGGELFSYLRKTGRLETPASRFYACEIIAALQYLHSMDVVYRDLKPENILVDGEGHVKITDFGFAKIVEDRTWTVCGTPEYLAPEVIQSKGHGKSVDWWALGILIFEMLVGHPPFYDENPFGIYQKVLAGKIVFPKSFDPVAKDLIKRLLLHDRTKRYGCLRGGAEDIKRHEWFRGIQWDRCLRRELVPPFVPEATSPDDTSMFDHYPESVDCPTVAISRAEQELFADF